MNATIRWLGGPLAIVALLGYYGHWMKDRGRAEVRAQIAEATARAVKEKQEQFDRALAEANAVAAEAQQRAAERQVIIKEVERVAPTRTVQECVSGVDARRLRSLQRRRGS